MTETLAALPHVRMLRKSDGRDETRAENHASPTAPPRCTPASPCLLKDAEAAAWLGIHPGTLRAWRCRGIGPAFIRLGRGPKARVRYNQRDLEAFAAQGHHVPDSMRAAEELANGVV